MGKPTIYTSVQDNPIAAGRGALKNMTSTRRKAPIPAAKYPFLFPSVVIHQ